MFIPKKYLTETLLFSKSTILDESTFLTEAQATAKQLVIDLNKLDTLLPELTKELQNSGALDILENIKKDCDDTLTLITDAKAKNFKKFKDFKELMDYIRNKASNNNSDEQFSDNMIKILQPLCYNTASDGNSVKDRLKDIRQHKGNVASHTATLQTRITSLENNIEELYKLFENSEEAEDDSDENPNNKMSLKGKLDWTAERARRLKNANGKSTSEILDKFYNDYYSIEYAGVNALDEDKQGIVAKLKSLDKILIMEFNKLGYNPEVNPFAMFLKIIIKLQKEKKSNIFSKLNTNNYGAIHNAFIEKSITGNMLGNYNTKNILFCENLYDYKGLDIINYLSLYSQTINSAKNDSKYADNPELLAAKIFIQQKQLSDDYAENIKQLLELSENQVILPGNGNEAKMRSYLEISELYRHLFKTVPKQKITKPIADELCEKVKKAGIIKATFKYLLSLNSLPKQKQQEYLDWFEKQNYKPSEDALERATAESKKILSGFIINNADAVDLLLFRLKNLLIDASTDNSKKKDEKKA